MGDFMNPRRSPGNFRGPAPEGGPMMAPPTRYPGGGGTPFIPAPGGGEDSPGPAGPGAWDPTPTPPAPGSGGVVWGGAPGGFGGFYDPANPPQPRDLGGGPLPPGTGGIKPDRPPAGPPPRNFGGGPQYQPPAPPRPSPLSDPGGMGVKQSAPPPPPTRRPPAGGADPRTARGAKPRPRY